MKKSKIIVPALGLLLLSTAASVSGTVAWFTASASTVVNTNEFTVKDSGGELEHTLTAGTGTAISGADATEKIGLASNTVLTDGSFNHVTKAVWAHNPNTGADDTTHCLNKGVDGESGDPAVKNWYAGTISPNAYYHAVSWSVTFTYTFGTSSQDVNLYFDVNATASKMTAGSAVNGSATQHTEYGFRIAMYSSTKTIVWADLQTNSNCGYIEAASGDPGVTSAKATYTLGSPMIDSTITDSTTGYVASNSATSTGSEPNCLGTFSGGSASATIDVTFVAWYDGTDPNVISGSTMAPVSATMNFFTRTKTA